jgi:hypothetical protein
MPELQDYEPLAYRRGESYHGYLHETPSESCLFYGEGRSGKVAERFSVYD